MKKKVDNRSLRDKVELRRWLLGEMNLQAVRVLDTCAGAGKIWTAMRPHVTIDRWIRCDIKPRQLGTLRLTATQAVDSLPLDTFNVIDIDPYGEPWEPYLHALMRFRSLTAFFLTRGRVANVVTSNISMIASGLPTEWPVPRTPALAHFLDATVLSRTWDYAEILHSAAVELPHVSYYALALRPHTRSKPL